jgi:hypothetical protein
MLKMQILSGHAESMDIPTYVFWKARPKWHYINDSHIIFCVTREMTLVEEWIFMSYSSSSQTLLHIRIIWGDLKIPKVMAQIKWINP